jgi:transcription antitermination factor NusG
MPVLPVEPFVYPHDLFARLCLPPMDESRWWVLHTRPRAEKALVRKLHGRSTAFFLPLYQHRFRSRGRWLCSHLPLFPGYVFLHGSQEERTLALETGHVARCLEVAAQERLGADLERVHRLMVSGEPLAPEQHLVPGTAVEISAGPLAGLHGKVLQCRGACRLLVEVAFLQRGVSVEVQDWMVRPTDRTGTTSVMPAVPATTL